MNYRLLFIILLFFSYPLYGEKIKSNQNEEQIVPLNTRILPNVTFRTYQSKNKISNNFIEFYNMLDKKQKTYKVSLVGVNLNSWLENPKYFKNLEMMANKFPIENLLDNLKSYNPNLIFNDPMIVHKALNTDIYTPYLKIFTNNSISLQFKDIRKVISYTRRYHVYGVSIGDLPYFGQPIEGGKYREINLGMIGGQINEIAVKLPETDIFLVAMINIIPNWLEERTDIFQINQQQLEIIIYAFDRNGKVLGGVGKEVDFWHKGQHFVMEQRIRSKIWETAISRQFYILPSYQIINQEEYDSIAKIPDIVLPSNHTPNLNNEQKYIIKAIEKRQSLKESINIQLFNKDAGKIYNIKYKKHKNKIKLVDRVIMHKNSIFLTHNDNPISLQYQELFVKLKNKIAEMPFFKKKLKDSNEGLKIDSLVNDGIQILLQDPYTYSNKLFYTNEVLPYELERDPNLFYKRKKEYYYMTKNIVNLKKEMKNKTKMTIQNIQRDQKERIFWYQQLLKVIQSNDMDTKEIQNQFDKWLSIYKSTVDTEIDLYKLTQKLKKKEILVMKLDFYYNRHKDYLSEKYNKKPKKIENKMISLNKKVVKLSNKMLVDQKFLTMQKKKENQYRLLKIQEKKRFQEYINCIPENINYDLLISKDNNKVINQNNKINMNLIANKYLVDLKLVELIFKQNKLSPLSKYEKKQKRKEKLENRLLFYEGFILGLTGNWEIKSYIEDRLIKI